MSYDFIPNAICFFLLLSVLAEHILFKDCFFFYTEVGFFLNLDFLIDYPLKARLYGAFVHDFQRKPSIVYFLSLCI